MFTKKSTSAPIFATCISLSSGNLFAAEETISSFIPIWPFLVIVTLIFFFRKQLNCVPSFKSKENTAPVEPDEPVAGTSTVSSETDTKTATATVQEPARVEPDKPASASIVIPESGTKTATASAQEPVRVEPDKSAAASIVIPETGTTAAVDENIIDLKDNGQQCQASTAKGTRCKRKTTLEDTSVTIDDKTYLLTVCRQHNTEQLKPFSQLIK